MDHINSVQRTGSAHEHLGSAGGEQTGRVQRVGGGPGGGERIGGGEQIASVGEQIGEREAPAAEREVAPTQQTVPGEVIGEEAEVSSDPAAEEEQESVQPTVWRAMVRVAVDLVNVFRTVTEGFKRLLGISGRRSSPPRS